MKPGNRIIYNFFLYFMHLNFSYSDDKITTSPLINVDEIKPSFEEVVEENENISKNQNLKEKKK